MQREGLVPSTSGGLVLSGTGSTGSSRRWVQPNVAPSLPGSLQSGTPAQNATPTSSARSIAPAGSSSFRSSPVAVGSNSSQSLRAAMGRTGSKETGSTDDDGATSSSPSLNAMLSPASKSNPNGPDQSIGAGNGKTGSTGMNLLKTFSDGDEERKTPATTPWTFNNNLHGVLGLNSPVAAAQESPKSQGPEEAASKVGTVSAGSLQKSCNDKPEAEDATNSSSRPSSLSVSQKNLKNLRTSKMSHVSDMSHMAVHSATSSIGAALRKGAEALQAVGEDFKEVISQENDVKERLNAAHDLGVSAQLALGDDQVWKHKDMFDPASSVGSQSRSLIFEGQGLSDFHLRDDAYLERFEKMMGYNPFENYFRNDGFPLSPTLWSFVFSKRVLFIESTMLLIALYTIILFPLAISFGNKKGRANFFNMAPTLTQFDIVVDLVFALGLALRFRISLLMHNTEVRDPRRIAKHRVKLPSFWCGVLSVLPAFSLLAREDPPIGIFLMKLLRVCELTDLPATFWQARQSAKLRMLRLFLAPVVGAHILTCLWIPANGYLDALSGKGTPWSDGDDVPLKCTWPQFFGGAGCTGALQIYLQAVVESMYLMLGMGIDLWNERFVVGRKIDPSSSPAAMMIMATMGVVGTIASAIIFSAIVVLLQQIFTLSIRRQETATFIIEAMEELDLPATTRRRIRKLYDFQSTNHDRHVLSVLFARDNTNVALDIEMRIHLYWHLLTTADLLKGGDMHFTLDVIMSLREEIMTPGDYICRKGDVGREMFFLLQGEVAILGPEEVGVIKILFAGEYFGEIALVKDQKRLAWVRANAYCIVLILSREEFHDILQYFPEEEERMKARVENIIANKTKKRTSNSSAASTMSEAAGKEDLSALIEMSDEEDSDCSDDHDSWDGNDDSPSNAKDELPASNKISSQLPASDKITSNALTPGAKVPSNLPSVLKAPSAIEPINTKRSSVAVPTGKSNSSRPSIFSCGGAKVGSGGLKSAMALPSVPMAQTNSGIALGGKGSGGMARASVAARASVVAPMLQGHAQGFPNFSASPIRGPGNLFISPSVLNSQDSVPWLTVDKEIEILIQELQTVRSKFHSAAVPVAKERAEKQDNEITGAIKEEGEEHDTTAPATSSSEQ